jgi:hypothetical protein
MTLKNVFTSFKMLAVVGFLSASAAQTSCSTEFDLNAPYDEITIVYGLLNQAEDTHLVSINKSFLGNGNAYEFAQVSDSSEYTGLSATVTEILDGQVSRTWILQDSAIENKEEGQWYNDNVTAYFFNCPDLNHADAAYWEPLDPEAEYEIEAVVSESGDPVVARTKLVNDFAINPQFSSPQFKVNFARQNSSIDNSYPTQEVKWVSSLNSRRYEVILKFRYTAFTSQFDSTEHVISWNLGTQKTFSDEGGEAMSEIIEGVNFYTLLQDRIAADGDVIRRYPRGIDFFYTVAGDDLHTYMEVNEPSTGIVQDRPEYTNVSNGIGIFSSRYVKTLEKEFSKNSMKELCEGQYTSSLFFRSDDIGWQIESWYNVTW